MDWKADWNEARENIKSWWRGEGMALCLTAPRDEPAVDIPKPAEPADLLNRWRDPAYRCSLAEYQMSRTCFFAEAFPHFDTYLGPGSLCTMLGSEPEFADTTVWYGSCISDPETYGEIRFDPTDNRWWDAHMALVEEGLRRANGRYLVGLPDLIENLDVLASMRGSETILYDLIERPAWVMGKLDEINRAYFDVFGRMFERVVDTDGGNAFCGFQIWGPGKTAKLQCDISCMISPDMFNQIVAPPLSRQCDWLDYSLYHLDGEDALQHLDSLLAIESLNAIEWTPIGASGKIDGMPSGGSPHWYDLYRRIRAAGKSVQAIQLQPSEVVPLLDAVGPEGMFLLVHAADQRSAEELLTKVEQFRR